jgi:ABC-type nitrate/sulfonate/bicarbonate transport system substrate-binding protein
MTKTRSRVLGVLGLIAILIAAIAAFAWPGRNDLELTLALENRSLSKIAYFIASDQGLFEKHGLNIELLMPAPGAERGITAVDHLGWWTRLKRRLGREKREVDIFTQGGTPMMLNAIQKSEARHRINIGSTDCTVRTHFVGRKGLQINSLQDLKGMRLGASARISTTGFPVFLLAKRLGWDPSRDFTFVDLRDEGFEELDAGKADAVSVNEGAYSFAVDNGYPILFDTAEWNEELAGNSLSVWPEWLESAEKREAARRLLSAIAEAISLYHQDRDIALRSMEKWNGMSRETAERIYKRGAWLPHKPYPCYAGYRKTLELYDSPDVRRHKPEEFYDDSIVRQIDATGYFDSLYPKSQNPS